jgi:hypothetical protein
MRYRSGEREVSVRISEKSMSSGVFGDSEPPVQTEEKGNQMVGILNKQAFEP